MLNFLFKWCEMLTASKMFQFLILIPIHYNDRKGILIFPVYRFQLFVSELKYNTKSDEWESDVFKNETMFVFMYNLTRRNHLRDKQERLIRLQNIKLTVTKKINETFEIINGYYGGNSPVPVAVRSKV